MRLSLSLVAALVVVGADAVSAQPLFSKAFAPGAITPGATATLSFAIDNALARGPATGLDFTDNLPAGVTVASPANAATTCTGGTLTAVPGTATVTYTGGAVAEGSACSVSVDVTSSSSGLATNVSGDLTSSAGNSGTAVAELLVAGDRPVFTKAFAPAATIFGSTVALTHTIDNTLNPSPASNLAFTDVLPAGLTIADPANASTDCTNAVVTAAPGGSTISVGPSFNSSVAAGSLCTVTVDVLAGAAGSFASVSGAFTSNVGFTNVSSGAASATLDVTVSTDAPVLTKSFVGDPVEPGDTVTLEFTIANPDRDFPATGITFTDDVDAALAGLVATALPPPGFCGPGSQMSGTSVLAVSGASLAPGASCSFEATLAVPAGAVSGSYLNTTSSVTATIDGAPVVGNAASSPLSVDADSPRFSKRFAAARATGGDTVTLEFTIVNQKPADAVTDIAFIDELTTGLPFPVSVTLPASGFCGPSSQMSLAFIATDRQGVSMTGGSLAAGASCVFSVDLDLPVGIGSALWENVTEPITATVGGQPVTGGVATDVLEIVGSPLQLSLEFTDDPVAVPDSATLEYRLQNASETSAATAIAFDHDLGAALPGLAATALPIGGFCGQGSQMTGSDVLSVTGASLAPGASCAFSVTLSVPGTALPGSVTTTTGTLSADVSGLAVPAPGVSATLEIAGVMLSKSFVDDPVIPGGTVTLEYTLENQTRALAATGIFFTDGFSAVLPGLAAAPPLPPAPCGGTLSGTTFLIFTGGSLAPGESCSFQVTLQVPGGAATGAGETATGATAKGAGEVSIA